MTDVCTRFVIVICCRFKASMFVLAIALILTSQSSYKCIIVIISLLLLIWSCCCYYWLVNVLTVLMHLVANARSNCNQTVGVDVSYGALNPTWYWSYNITCYVTTTKQKKILQTFKTYHIRSKQDILTKL